MPSWEKIAPSVIFHGEKGGFFRSFYQIPRVQDVNKTLLHKIGVFAILDPVTTTMRSPDIAVRHARRTSSRHSRVSQRGFTLTELLVVAAIIAILASLLLPALNRARGRTHSIACLNNLKQLQFGWHMYVDDNDGQLPLNNTESSKSEPAVSWCPGNAKTDTTTDNIRRGLLYPFVQNTEIYHCPADKSRVETDDGHPLEQFRTRSYSMSSSINYDAPGGTIPTFKKYSEIINPPPHMLFVFVDVNEHSIGEGRFELYPPDSPKTELASSWVSVPSDRHNIGANMSFADAHVEHWNWEAPKTFAGSKKGTPAGSSSSSSLVADGDARDLRRMQDRIAQESSH